MLKRIQIDLEGYLHFDGVRITDEEFGRQALSRIERDEDGRFWTDAGGVKALVEAFDQPLVARTVTVINSQQSRTAQGPLITAHFPYGHSETLMFQSLSQDDWSRIHARTPRGIPAVLSHAAQASFLQDPQVTLPSALRSLFEESDAMDANKEEFWSELYQNKQVRWDLEEPSPVLGELFKKIDFHQKSALVPGCGPGHDAAELARRQAHVTAVDISPEAIKLARSRYADLNSISWVTEDVFKLKSLLHEKFDFVVEHTCYCAVDPHRQELVNTWSMLIKPGGWLIGIFFVFDRPQGPPFGATEYEIRRSLQSDFKFLYWSRKVPSIPEREGMELAVIAEKI